MKPYLLYRSHDFDANLQKFEITRMVIQDLELDILFNAMAGEEKFIFDAVRNVVLSSAVDTDTIMYRQSILKDCLKNPEIVRNMYHISAISVDWYKQNSTVSFREPAVTTLGRYITSIEFSLNTFQNLKKLTDNHKGNFESEGFKKFFAMLDMELTEKNIAGIQKTLEGLKIQNEIQIRVNLGKGNKGTDYALQPYRNVKKLSTIRQFLTGRYPSQYSFEIGAFDEIGFRTLEEMMSRGIKPVSNILARFSESICSFFSAMKTELGFYVGCINLNDQLNRIGDPMCFPVPCDRDNRTLSFKGLYDACLSLKMETCVIGNDAIIEGKDLVLITGTNRGGKSSFLRSIGLAQLMMQSGMFVPAESFRSGLCEGIFTHFKRQEDRWMKSGKLDEELKRMSMIVDCLKPDSMALFNESFAATNEREGSEISRQIVCVLLESRIQVFFVTHLYEFSRDLYEKKMENALFLRAERKSDGERTFRMIEGEPLQTSYGDDLYNQIFSRHPVDKGKDGQKKSAAGVPDDKPETSASDGILNEQNPRS